MHGCRKDVNVYFALICLSKKSWPILLDRLLLEDLFPFDHNLDYNITIYDISPYDLMITFFSDKMMLWLRENTILSKIQYKILWRNVNITDIYMWLFGPP